MVTIEHEAGTSIIVVYHTQTNRPINRKLGLRAPAMYLDQIYVYECLAYSY